MLFLVTLERVFFQTQSLRPSLEGCCLQYPAELQPISPKDDGTGEVQGDSHCQLSGYSLNCEGQLSTGLHLHIPVNTAELDGLVGHAISWDEVFPHHRQAMSRIHKGLPLPSPEDSWDGHFGTGILAGPDIRGIDLAKGTVRGGALPLEVS